VGYRALPAQPPGLAEAARKVAEQWDPLVLKWGQGLSHGEVSEGAPRFWGEDHDRHKTLQRLNDPVLCPLTTGTRFAWLSRVVYGSPAGTARCQKQPPSTSQNVANRKKRVQDGKSMLFGLEFGIFASAYRLPPENAGCGEKGARADDRA